MNVFASTNKLLTVYALLSFDNKNMIEVQFKSKKIYDDYKTIGYLKTEFDCFTQDGNRIEQISLIDHSTSSGDSAMAELQIEKDVYSIQVK